MARALPGAATTGVPGGTVVRALQRRAAAAHHEHRDAEQSGRREEHARWFWNCADDEPANFTAAERGGVDVQIRASAVHASEQRGVDTSRASSLMGRGSFISTLHSKKLDCLKTLRD